VRILLDSKLSVRKLLQGERRVCQPASKLIPKSLGIHGPEKKLGTLEDKVREYASVLLLPLRCHVPGLVLQRPRGQRLILPAQVWPVEVGHRSVLVIAPEGDYVGAALAHERLADVVDAVVWRKETTGQQ
jgi:hypothetical protein